MLDETGFYAPSMAHNALPPPPPPRALVFFLVILYSTKSLRNRL